MDYNLVGISTGGNERKYQGLSTVTKPTVDNNNFPLGAGSAAYELDTGYEYIFDPNNICPVTGTYWWPKNPPAQFVFQNAVTAVGPGNVLTVGSGKTLKVSICNPGNVGSISARTVNFNMINQNGDVLPLQMYNPSTGFSASSTTNTSPETWITDVTALYQVSISISTLTASGGASTTINGTVVS